MMRLCQDQRAGGSQQFQKSDFKQTPERNIGHVTRNGSVGGSDFNKSDPPPRGRIEGRRRREGEREGVHVYVCIFTIVTDPAAWLLYVCVRV